MQTFLPYPEFERSAAVLDRLRLGKQRLETLQIIRTLLGESSGWKAHPAVRMWEGHVTTLAEYGVAICDEWLRRGYRDNLRQPLFLLSVGKKTKPWWLGEESFHSSHRARLLMKDPAWYSQFGWTEQPSENYWWPIDHSPTPIAEHLQTSR